MDLGFVADALWLSRADVLLLKNVAIWVRAAEIQHVNHSNRDWSACSACGSSYSHTGGGSSQCRWHGDFFFFFFVTLHILFLWSGKAISTANISSPLVALCSEKCKHNCYGYIMIALHSLIFFSKLMLTVATAVNILHESQSSVRQLFTFKLYSCITVIHVCHYFLWPFVSHYIEWSLVGSYSASYSHLQNIITYSIWSPTNLQCEQHLQGLKQHWCCDGAITIDG